MKKVNLNNILQRIESETPMVGFYFSAVDELQNDELGFHIYVDPNWIICEFDHPLDEGVIDSYYLASEDLVIDLIKDYCADFGIHE